MNFPEAREFLFLRPVAVGCGLLMTVALNASLAAAELSSPKAALAPSGNTSLRLEAQHAIEKGLNWLEKHQDTNGFWSSPDHPAVTALALTAFKLQSGSRSQKAEPGAVKKGYAWL